MGSGRDGAGCEQVRPAAANGLVGGARLSSRLVGAALLGWRTIRVAKETPPVRKAPKRVRDSTKAKLCLRDRRVGGDHPHAALNFPPTFIFLIFGVGCQQYRVLNRVGDRSMEGPSRCLVRKAVFEVDNPGRDEIDPIGGHPAKDITILVVREIHAAP
jgi:hypothetical protein